MAGGTASLVVNPNGISVTGIITGNGSGLTGVASTDNIITSYGATFLSNVRVAGIFTAANAYVTGILTAQTLNYNNVVDVTLCTTVSNQYDVKVSTIEHLMGAFYGLGVDNAIVELDSQEVPIIDGSCLLYTSPSPRDVEESRMPSSA